MLAKDKQKSKHAKILAVKSPSRTHVTTHSFALFLIHLSTLLFIVHQMSALRRSTCKQQDIAARENKVPSIPDPPEAPAAVKSQDTEGISQHTAPKEVEHNPATSVQSAP